MSQTPKQKASAAELRRDKRAAQIVGRFLLVCNVFEHRMNRALEKLLRLDQIGAGILCANLNFQAKMNIIISMVDVYSEEVPKRHLDSLKKIYNRIFALQTEWRNVVAHTIFRANEDGTIKFHRIQARRSLKIPEYTKTKSEFDDACAEWAYLARGIEAAVKIVIIKRDAHEATGKEQPTLNLEPLGVSYPPPSQSLGPLHFPSSSPKTTIQIPAKPHSKGKRRLN